MGIYLTQLAYQSLSESQALNAILTTITIHRSTSTVFRTVQLNCFRQNGIDSSAEHNRASTTHCFTSRAHSVMTRRYTASDHMLDHDDESSSETLPRPINNNNTQHFKGNQRAEQNHLLYKTVKYFNCNSHKQLLRHPSSCLSDTSVHHITCLGPSPSPSWSQSD